MDVNHFHLTCHPVTSRPARHLLAALCGSLLLCTSAFATPTEEITRAVTVTGVSDVSQAQPREFSKAFRAVAHRIAPRDLPVYVAAAINLRQDLAPQIVSVAVKAAVRNWEAKPEALCGMIERIVKAAISMNPETAASIAKAGASASPESRRCVLDAAISAAPDRKDAIVTAVNAKAQPFAFLTFSASDSSGFSFTAATFSPANISNLGDNGSVNSPEQPPSH